MSTTEPSPSPAPEKRDDQSIHEDTNGPGATAPTDLSAEVEDDLSKQDNLQPSEMSEEAEKQPQGPGELSGTIATDAPAIAQPSTATTSQDPLRGQMESLTVNTSLSVNSTEPRPSSSASTPPPPPPAKDDVYGNSSSQPAGDPTSAPSSDKDLPEVPDNSDPESKRDRKSEEARDENDSQPEIQNIMGQFQDPARSTGQQEIMSPRLGLAEFRGANYFPPRRASLEHNQHPGPGSSAAPPDNQPRPSISQHPHRPGGPEEPVLTRQSSASTIPPLPEPEPDQPFDFHRFLEQLRHRTADPVAKFLRSFLMEFGKRQWMVHEQVKIISDFLAFITNKMAMCEVWRNVSDSEFDNAKEGMEKLVMNRLYSQTFSPAIPAPPTIPRSASRSRRREIERLHGPWRRGQHQEDIERDDILAQKIRIYSWVSEDHLDIPPVSGSGRRFLNLAQQELLKINGYRAPRDKVICILNCCKVIFGLLRNTKKGDTSADAFVPLLIYVVLHANPDHLVSNIQYILRFRNQDKLGGEAGYYLSSLSGAIQFIETLDRTSLTVSDEEFERNVEEAVSAIAEQNRESESLSKKPSRQPAPGPASSQAGPSRKDNGSAHSSDDDSSAPVTGLLRTIQKPLSTIGRIFSDEPDTTPSASSQDRPLHPASTPQPGVAPPRLSPNVYQPPRTSSDERSRAARDSADSAQKNLSRVLDAQDAAARQASAEDAEARRIQRAEHNTVVETLSNMFPNLDRDVIEDVVKMKEGRCVDNSFSSRFSFILTSFK
ncbi:hypothetical protein NUU61_007907 [Penicillium alfredii]|uniref:VPS9 domain-containing protein n=1 Tax=Penicillium alfredii TaxID=1506179 RepID=A0A9W9ERL8_9EURO|nr:uncharacterized protein NUU61_007907 [Penicillium alfredii]KAJ5086600.1 hypothetical protein NUU61_007907 [Penicillium alfredii]